MTMTVGIYIFNEVEVLDFSGPFEVFSTASRVKARLDADMSPLFDVFTLSEKGAPVLARGGLQIIPRYSIADHPGIDVLIIPGGIVSDELGKEHLISWIKASTDTAAITASVCTGAFLLAKAGLLLEKAATTHWEDIDDLAAMFPDIYVKKDARWVEQGNIVTAAGISAGIDMSLHLVSRLDTMNLAVQTARQMEYSWNGRS